jgi:hypothetical protein
MVASVPYVKATEPHMLETYTPEVTKAYITSRLESVHVVVRYVNNVSIDPGFLHSFVQIFFISKDRNNDID